MDVALLLGRDLALDPDEAVLLAELVAQFPAIQFRENGVDQLGGLVLVDHLAGISENRDRLHVGGHGHAIAVNDGRPGR